MTVSSVTNIFDKILSPSARTHIQAVFKREFSSYFDTPVAYVFLVVYLLLSGVFTFYLGNFLEREQADLEAFFIWHPWLYLFLVPAISMRLWSEERRLGTLELLVTLPIQTWQAVCGKFLAAWAFIGIALSLTFPIWITVNYLGNPDNGVIVASYIGSFIMAGGFLAIGSCMSALTRNQVIALVLSVTVCFLFIMSGFTLVINAISAWFPQVIVDMVSAFSFISHFTEFSQGIIGFKNIVYFASLIIFWLYINTWIVKERRV